MREGKFTRVRKMKVSLSPRVQVSCERAGTILLYSSIGSSLPSPLRDACAVRLYRGGTSRTLPCLCLCAQCIGQGCSFCCTKQRNTYRRGACSPTAGQSPKHVRTYTSIIGLKYTPQHSSTKRVKTPKSPTFSQTANERTKKVLVRRPSKHGFRTPKSAYLILVRTFSSPMSNVYARQTTVREGARR